MKCAFGDAYAMIFRRIEQDGHKRKTTVPTVQRGPGETLALSISN